MSRKVLSPASTATAVEATEAAKGEAKVGLALAVAAATVTAVVPATERPLRSTRT